MRLIMYRRPVAHALYTLLISVCVCCLTGCSKSKPEKEERTISGTALSIDEATGKVAMNYWNQKKQIEMRIEGTVTPTTEILINGRVAQLREIRIGEQVIVTGYREGDGNRKRLIATKVQVMRDEWSGGPTTTTKATTKPGAETAAK